MIDKKPVKFCFGTESTYSNMQNKDSNAIYFISNNSGGGRLYVGEQSYNVDIVDNLELDSNSNIVAPSVAAVNTGLNKKVNKCNIITDSVSTTLPSIVSLSTDTEYRFTALNGSLTTSNLVLYIPADTTYQFYSSVVLSRVNFSGIITNFVTLDSSSPTRNVRFLNADFDLSGKNVVEILFFSNGVDICCIGSGYTVQTS